MQNALNYQYNRVNIENKIPFIKFLNIPLVGKLFSQWESHIKILTLILPSPSFF